LKHQTPVVVRFWSLYLYPVDGHIAKNAIPFWNDVIIVKNIHKTQMFFVEAFGNKVQVVKVS
jgi:hypothetical protein